MGRTGLLVKLQIDWITQKKKEQGFGGDAYKHSTLDRRNTSIIHTGFSAGDQITWYVMLCPLGFFVEFITGQWSIWLP